MSTNYAFPEPGVTLRSLIWRKKNTFGDTHGQKYYTTPFEYERPSAIAIKELVPSGLFYAEGKRIKIDQIDLNISKIEEWRLCRSCSYTVDFRHDTFHYPTCPRCGDTQWSDEGRKRKMIKLRQVIATNSAKDSLIGDDQDERKPTFFKHQMLADFDPQYWEKGFLIDNPEFPFGFEFISKVTFRELNFGETQLLGTPFEVASESFPCSGFRICRHCGKVQNGENAEHTLACRTRGKSSKNNQDNFEEVLYLFRQFESEALRLLMPFDTINSHEKLHSFMAALQLGLDRYFKGNINHLRTLISYEPQGNSNLRKPFLFLYDTIPGGTGYLRQLIKEENTFFDLLTEALKVLVSCDCDDGCYQCLLAYRNSFAQDQTSRRIAKNLLNHILKFKEQLKPHSQGLSQVPLNALFDSVLEQRFIEVLRSYRYHDQITIIRQEMVGGKTGYFLQIGNMSWTIEPQVLIGEAEGVSVPCCADFVFYPTKNTTNILPMAIFTDGWQYHCERLEQDFAQRMALSQSGKYHVWSLSWFDIESQLTKQKKDNYYVNFLEFAVNNSFFKSKNQLFQQYQCPEFLPLIKENSFIWLVNYLANPNQKQWLKFALVSSLAHINPLLHKDQVLFQQWESELLSIINHELWSDLKNIVSPQLMGKFDYFSSADLPLCRLYTAIAPTEHRNFNPDSAVFILWLNDDSSNTEDEKQKTWQSVLRHFNLIQFSQHSYLIYGHDQALSVPKVHSLSISSSQENSDPWENFKSLLFDQDSIALINQLKMSRWPLPSVGYELTNDMGTVLAEGEFVWLREKLALVIAEDDVSPFQSQGWYVATIGDVLNQPEMFREKYFMNSTG